MATHCPVCKKEYSLFDKILGPSMCSDCFKQGKRIPKEEISAPSTHAVTSPTSATRYPALITLAAIYRVLAFVVGLAALITIIVGIDTLESGGGLLILGGLLGGIIGVVTNLAIAEGIRVFIDIEENTRNTLLHISNQHEESIHNVEQIGRGNE